TNAQRQPRLSAIHGTTRGAMIAPMFVPELKMPVASARSHFGNHSATVLIAAGKLPDSPSPSPNRAAPNVTALFARPCDIAATLHTATASAYPLRVPSVSISRPANASPSAYAAWKALTI